MTVVSFFGGVRSDSVEDRLLAYRIGRMVAACGFTLQHGGYNGLMEDAARGAADAGGDVVAISLAGVEWGDFNPHVTDSVHLPSMGDRIHRFLDPASLVVAMGGGIGTLHEVTTALWYSSNIRRIPVWLVGKTAVRLSDFLRSESWLYETPTRPLGFLREVPDQIALDRVTAELASDTETLRRSSDLATRVHSAAVRRDRFRRPDGEVLDEYFDEYLLAADPGLLRDVARVLARLLPDGVERLVGLELSGVPLAVAVSAEAGVQVGLLRRHVKAYGTGRQLEGAAVAGRRVVVVDDVVRTGSQILRAAAVLREAGAMVTTAVCVLDREVGGRDRLAEHGIELRSAFTAATLEGGSPLCR